MSSESAAVKLCDFLEQNKRN